MKKSIRVVVFLFVIAMLPGWFQCFNSGIGNNYHLKLISLASASDSCGAYVAPGVWKEFDCYNLAAIGKTTNDDPFTPSWRLIGGHWQWGRKGPDPSQWYDTNTQHFAHGPTGPDYSEANHDPISGWDDQHALDGAWSDNEKTANDPCPAGFRVPTKRQWQGVIDNNILSNVGSWTRSVTDYSSASFFGNDLMLPAAGDRGSGNGGMGDRGNRGYYWSSSELGSDNAWGLNMVNGSARTSDYSGGRLHGNSIRCIADTSTSPSPLIQVDGSADDWAGIPAYAQDPMDDLRCDTGPDLKAVYFAKDSQYLYWRIDSYSGEIGSDYHPTIHFYQKADGKSDYDIQARAWGHQDSGVIWQYTDQDGFVKIHTGSEFGKIDSVAEGKIPLSLFSGKQIIKINAHFHNSVCSPDFLHAPFSLESVPGPGQTDIPFFGYFKGAQLYYETRYENQDDTGTYRLASWVEMDEKNNGDALNSLSVEVNGTDSSPDSFFNYSGGYWWTVTDAPLNTLGKEFIWTCGNQEIRGTVPLDVGGTIPPVSNIRITGGTINNPVIEWDRYENTTSILQNSQYEATIYAVQGGNYAEQKRIRFKAIDQPKIDFSQIDFEFLSNQTYQIRFAIKQYHDFKNITAPDGVWMNVVNRSVIYWDYDPSTEPGPEDPTASILSKASPKMTVPSGSQATVYGTEEANELTLESGAKAELIHFPGFNTVRIQSSSDAFQVSRSGTVVTFEGTNGTLLKIPASTSVQTIAFSDRAPLTLSIYEGQVMLDDQVIKKEPRSVSGKLVNLGEVVLEKTEEIHVGGGEVSLKSSDHRVDGTSVSIPQGALDEPVNITVKALKNDELPVFENIEEPASLLFDITIDKSISKFNADITITLPLINPDIGQNYYPAYWNNGFWQRINNFSVNDSKNLIRFEIDHLTEFKAFKEKKTYEKLVLEADESGSVTSMTRKSEGRVMVGDPWGPGVPHRGFLRFDGYNKEFHPIFHENRKVIAAYLSVHVTRSKKADEYPVSIYNLQNPYSDTSAGDVYWTCKDSGSGGADQKTLNGMDAGTLWYLINYYQIWSGPWPIAGYLESYEPSLLTSQDYHMDGVETGWIRMPLDPEPVEQMLTEMCQACKKISIGLTVYRDNGDYFVFDGVDSINKPKFIVLYEDPIDTPSPLTVSINSSISDDSVMVGEPITFQADVTGGSGEYIYSWGFGDDKKSDSARPTHVYTSTGNFSVSLTVTDEETENSKTASLEVTVREDDEPGGCYAYIAPNVKREFDCYNLGAAGRGTHPWNEPSWKLNGGYWQWGRKGPVDLNANTPYFAHGPTGEGAGDANSGAISGWSGDYAEDGAWYKDGEKNIDNDPCPTGFRVPTIGEWEDVLAYNEKEYVGDSWTSGATNYSSGLKLGDALFLPAAGVYRKSGELNYRGLFGNYWSSSERGTYYAWGLYFSEIEPDELYYSRLCGLSVRCISE